MERLRVEGRGLRCPACTDLLGEAVTGQHSCPGCGARYAASGDHGVVRVGRPQATFAQDLDATIRDELLPVLAELPPPSCTEWPIMQLADRREIWVGNPVWEGRADLARTLMRPGSVVAEIGCGFGA